MIVEEKVEARLKECENGIREQAEILANQREREIANQSNYCSIKCHEFTNYRG
jgi:hypothetical protein